MVNITYMDAMGCLAMGSTTLEPAGLKPRKGQKRSGPAADGRNPANKLRLVVYPIIYSRVL